MCFIWALVRTRWMILGIHPGDSFSFWELMHSWLWQTINFRLTQPSRVWMASGQFYQWDRKGFPLGISLVCGTTLACWCVYLQCSICRCTVVHVFPSLPLAALLLLAGYFLQTPTKNDPPSSYMYSVFWLLALTYFALRAKCIWLGGCVLLIVFWFTGDESIEKAWKLQWLVLKAFPRS